MKKANELIVSINGSLLYFRTNEKTAKRGYECLLKAFENSNIDVSEIKFGDCELRDRDRNIIDKFQIDPKNMYRYYDCNHDCDALYEAYENGKNDERARILKAIEENNKVSTNTDSINSIKSTLNSLNSKDDSNSSSLNNLAKRVSALESNSNNHYLEYIGYATPSNYITLQKNYSIIIKYSSSRIIGESYLNVISGASCKKGYTYEPSVGSSYVLLGYAI